MGVKYLVTEISLEDYRHTRKWIVDVDQGSDFNYRGRTSSNAFFHGTNKRNYSDTSLYYGEHLEDARDKSEVMIECGSSGIDFDNLPEVESIFKFYEIIGYDYKKKRFM